MANQHTWENENDRFFSKVSKNGPGGCWLWTGAITSDGYGSYWVGNKSFKAHRIAYQMSVGTIPSGLQIDHLCRIRNCVNTDHMELVTSKENSLRGMGWAGRLGNAGKQAARTHCKQGHLFDLVNTRVAANGWRYCRTCNREKARRIRKAAVLRLAIPTTLDRTEPTPGQSPPQPR